MNCLFLVLLLLCCGNNNGSGCGCFGGRNMSECDDDFGRRGGQGRGRGRDREDGCGCNDRDRDDGCGCNDRDRNDGSGCNDRDRNDGGRRRNDDCPEPRLEPRPFIPYPGPSGGRDDSGNRGGCNCAD